MSDELDMAKLRTTSPATGIVEMIRRCRWAHARIEALTAENAALRAQVERAESALTECREEIDDYIRHEYPFDHPVQERYRRRDFSANPARVYFESRKATP